MNRIAFTQYIFDQEKFRQAVFTQISSFTKNPNFSCISNTLHGHRHGNGVFNIEF